MFFRFSLKESAALGSTCTRQVPREDLFLTEHSCPPKSPDGGVFTGCKLLFAIKDKKNTCGFFPLQSHHEDVISSLACLHGAHCR